MVWHEHNNNLNRITGRTDNGHIPAMPLHLGIIRFFQLILAIIVVGLAGYAASQFGSGWDAYAFTFFTFAWTILYFIWLGVSTLVAPHTYHVFAHLPIEVLTTIWWLVDWALLANLASDFGPSKYYYNGPYYGGYYAHTKIAVNCTKAAAALGAVNWVLFVITTVFLGIAFHRSRTENRPIATTTPAVAEQHQMHSVV